MEGEKKQTLAEMFVELNTLSEDLVASGGEMTPEIEAQFQALEISLPNKVDGYFLVMERMEFEAAYFKAKADQFDLISKSMRAARERLKNHLKFIMENQHLKELRGNEYMFQISSSGQALEFNESLVPEEYKKTKTEIIVDKNKIMDDLKLGVGVPGCHLRPVFRLSEKINKQLEGKK